MRSGWFQESHRHSLAARGVVTTVGRGKQYFSAKDVIKGWFAQSTEEKNIREMRKGELRAHVMKRLLDAEKAGKVQSGAVEAFAPALENSLKLYDHGNPYDSTKDELDRKIDLHLQTHAKAGENGNGMMPWSEKSVPVHAHHEKEEGGLPVSTGHSSNLSGGVGRSGHSSGDSGNSSSQPDGETPRVVNPLFPGWK
jgi:hypothetical protein